MKWTQEEINKLISLIKVGKKYNEIALLIKRDYKSIKNKAQRLKENYFKHNKPKTKKCLNCDNEISINKKFCSQSCSATYNNKLRIKKPSRLRYQITCLNCGKDGKSVGRIFCSNKCYVDNKRKKRFNKIESGDLTLSPRQYKLYLIHKYGNKCMECGWCEINPVTGKVPIELEHIDGDSNNNKLENLKLLCPNHHSLTPTYKSLNKGKGRHSRMKRYNEGKSF